MHFTKPCIALLAILSPSFVTASPISTPSDEHTSANPANIFQRTIAKRNNVSVACGLWATVNFGDAGDGLGEDADEVTVGPQSCNRIGCYDTSGVYVCNDQDVEITIPMSEAIDQVAYLKDTCGAADGDFGSGQVFSDSYGGYNVNLAVCDTSVSPALGPSAYHFPGPNGDPQTTCGGNSGVPCPGASCIEGTIVIDRQESINCYDYLGPAYAGAGSTATFSTSRTISEMWTVGADLSISTSDLFIVSYSLGFSASYAETTTTGDTAGITADCGDSDDGDYTCGMHISPQCFAMTGTCQTETLGTVPWANVAPQLNAPDGQSVYFPSICTCPNCADALNPGAPDNMCPMDCATCDPNV